MNLTPINPIAQKRLDLMNQYLLDLLGTNDTDHIINSYQLYDRAIYPIIDTTVTISQFKLFLIEYQIELPLKIREFINTLPDDEKLAKHTLNLSTFIDNNGSHIVAQTMLYLYIAIQLNKTEEWNNQ